MLHVVRNLRNGCAFVIMSRKSPGKILFYGRLLLGTAVLRATTSFTQKSVNPVGNPVDFAKYIKIQNYALLKWSYAWYMLDARWGAGRVTCNSLLVLIFKANTKLKLELYFSLM